MHLGMKTALLMLFCCGWLVAEPLYITFPSDVNWITRRTNHFEIIYRRGYDDFALRTLKNAERAHKILAPLFPQGPELTYIVLADFNDSTNGYSVDLPYPHIVIFAAPPEPSGTLAALDDWLFSIVLHEYVHTLHLYPSKGAWSLLRAIFGPIILPNGLQPTHFHEGLATFYETQFTTRGRGRGTEFPMYRRMAVEEKKWGDQFAPLDLFDGSTSRWPGGTSAYFFGYTLYEELFRKKGTKGIYELVDDYSKNWPYFVNGPLEKIYGFDYPTAWKNIFARTEIEAKKEIADIKREGLSEIEFLTDTRFSKWDLAKVPYLEPDKEVVVYRSASPKEGGYLEVFDVAKKKRVRRKNLGSSRTEGICAGLREGEPWIISVENRSKDHYSTNYVDVWQPDRDETVSISSDGSEWSNLNHIHLLGCNEDLNHLLAYRELGGEGSVFDFSLVDGPKKMVLPRVQIHRFWRIPEGSRVTALLGGNTPWIFVRNGADTEAYFWQPKRSPQLAFKTKAHLFQLRRKEGQLYFIGDLNGRNEIMRWDPKTQSIEKVAALLSGTNSFVFQQKDFLATVYRHGGYDLAKVVPLAKPRTLYSPDPLATEKLIDKSKTKKGREKKGKEKANEKKKKVALQELPAKRTPAAAAKAMTSAVDNEVELSIPRRYTPWSTLLPRTWIPSFLFVPDGIQFLIWVPGFDLSQTHYYDIIGGYDHRGAQGQPFIGLNYRYRFLKTTQLQTNLFYNPNYLILSTGAAFQTIWGGSLALSSLVPILGIPIRWTLSAIAQRVEQFGGYAANQSMGFGVGLSYDFGYETRPQSVSPQSGTTLSIVHQQFFKQVGSSDNYYRLIAEIKTFLAAPWWDSHIWALTIKGGSTYGTTPTNSYFQSGGEILFSQARTYYQNRGFAYATFTSSQILNASLEYRFPLWRVERGLGLKPVFLKNIHGRLIADTTSVKERSREVANRFFSSVGAEILTDWTFSYYLPAQLRLGAYHGIGPFGEPIRVVMGMDISL